VNRADARLAKAAVCTLSYTCRTVQHADMGGGEDKLEQVMQERQAIAGQFTRVLGLAVQRLATLSRRDTGRVAACFGGYLVLLC
jgi:hypothetical protein